MLLVNVYQSLYPKQRDKKITEEKMTTIIICKQYYSQIPVIGYTLSFVRLGDHLLILLIFHLHEIQEN
jgi:hypothetical protein